jgi:hypothetical protein
MNDQIGIYELFHNASECSLRQLKYEEPLSCLALQFRRISPFRRGRGLARFSAGARPPVILLAVNTLIATT